MSFSMGPPAVMGATDIFILEFEKLFTAVDAPALSEAVTTSEA